MNIIFKMIRLNRNLIPNFLALFLLISTHCSAALISFTDFSADENVFENSGVITFNEDLTSSEWYFYNDAFEVANDATLLTFNYKTLIDSSPFISDLEKDFFTFDVNFNSELLVNNSIRDGFFSFDLTSFQGQQISLAWGLLWAGDNEANSVLEISNINIETSSVPIAVSAPQTFLLMLLSHVFLLSRTRKNIFL